YNQLRGQLSRWLSPTSELQLESLARRAADSCLSDIQGRMSLAAEEMNRSELAGYVRARARRSIEHQVRLLSREERSASAEMHDRIVSKALERVVQVVCRQAMICPVRVASYRQAA